MGTCTLWASNHFDLGEGTKTYVWGYDTNHSLVAVHSFALANPSYPNGFLVVKDGYRVVTRFNNITTILPDGSASVHTHSYGSPYRLRVINGVFYALYRLSSPITATILYSTDGTTWNTLYTATVAATPYHYIYDHTYDPDNGVHYLITGYNSTPGFVSTGKLWYTYDFITFNLLTCTLTPTVDTLQGPYALQVYDGQIWYTSYTSTTTQARVCYRSYSSLNTEHVVALTYNSSATTTQLIANKRIHEDKDGNLCCIANITSPAKNGSCIFTYNGTSFNATEGLAADRPYVNYVYGLGPSCGGMAVYPQEVLQSGEYHILVDGPDTNVWIFPDPLGNTYMPGGTTPSMYFDAGDYSPFNEFWTEEDTCVETEYTY